MEGGWMDGWVVGWVEGGMDGPTYESEGQVLKGQSRVQIGLAPLGATLPPSTSVPGRH